MATEEKKTSTTDFGEYRREMHPGREAEVRQVVPTPHKAVRMAFGIFMILVYAGMGVCLFCNVFNWDSSFTWVRWVLGSVLILYAIFRGYRQISGADYYSK